MKLFIKLLIIFISVSASHSMVVKSAQADYKACGVFEKRVGENDCEHFTVPSNAHLTYSGNSWDCNRGFKMSTDKTKCEEIKIPGNAQANTIGSFNCNSGFRKEGNECTKVPDIENGKFYETGADFYCVKGYRRNEDKRTCDKITAPLNAFLDDTSLDGWKCFSGYIKNGDECKKFDLPEHAFWFHDYWGCEVGFKKNYGSNQCDKINIPENAHAVSSYDGWLCNSGYTKNYDQNTCEKNK